MAAKKTPEELRAKNRERQRKWRANNLPFAQLKSRNAQRIRRGTMEPMGPPVPNDVPNLRNFVPNEVPKIYGETHLGPVEGVDVPYNEGGGPGVQNPRRGVVSPTSGPREAQTMDERLDIDPPPASSKALTSNEAETYRMFEELKARKSAGKLNRATGSGVEVELKL